MRERERRAREVRLRYPRSRLDKHAEEIAAYTLNFVGLVLFVVIWSTLFYVCAAIIIWLGGPEETFLGHVAFVLLTGAWGLIAPLAIVGGFCYISDRYQLRKRLKHRIILTLAPLYYPQKAA